MNEIKPITPEEALENKDLSIHPGIHPGIIKIINDIISTQYSKGGSVTIKEKDIVNMFLKGHSEFTVVKVYNDHMLDFESLYSKNGWKVEYDKPAYNETYEATYKFSAKK